MQKYIAEFVGTFALVFCGTGAIVTNAIEPGLVGNAGIAVSFGVVVMAMIYSFQDVSGAHINPAVSIAFMLNKQLPFKTGLIYILVQFLGGIAASLVLSGLFGLDYGLGQTNPSGSESTSFWLEFMLTFFLMLVILKVSSSKNASLLTGTAVGGVVLMEAYFAGPICGASMNPARSLAPALVAGDTAHLWIYLTATTLGAIAALPVHWATTIKPD